MDRARRTGRRRRAAALRRELGGVVVCCALAALAGLLAARAAAISGNTLEASGRWRVTKSELERTLLGARSFLTEPQALAGGELDLGAWHGFHEVLLDRPMDPAELTVRFRLVEGAYLVVIFNERAGEGFSGLRMGWTRRYPSIFFDATAEGEFLRTQRTGLPPLRDPSWRTLTLRFADDGVEATLGDGAPMVFATPLAAPQRIGLRSGARSVRVDEVSVTTRDGRTFRETFDRPAGARRIALLSALAAALSALAVAALAAGGAPLRRRLFALATVELVAVVGLLLWQPVAARRAAAYPQADARLLEREEALRLAELDRVAAEIDRQHPQNPPPGTRRILFLGASQTWGAGAARDEEVWVRRLEELLNRSAPRGVVFECVNAGVSSLRSHHLRAAFRDRWADLEPWAVILNQATNDRRPEELESNLEAIVERARAGGARVVLLLEPNAPEWPSGGLGPKHAAVRRLAERRGVPLIDLQSALEERQDAGFLWWDIVHLTSFGQRLVADVLHRELLRLGFAAPAEAAAETDPGP